MLRSLRMLMIVLSAALVLSAVQIDASAKKKSSKRKHKKIQSVSVFAEPSTQSRVRVTSAPNQRTPIIVASPWLSEIRDEEGINHSAAAQTSAPSGPVSNGAGDSDAPRKRTWTTAPNIGNAGGLIISEFRLRGPGGTADEFIEIYNDFGADHTVSSTTVARSTGYGIAASDNILRCSIPNGTVIPARGHYLCVNSVGYSLANYGGTGAATGDATYTREITDGEDPDGVGGNPPLPRQGIALYNNDVGGVHFTAANRFDSVGPASETNTLYKEGTGLPDPQDVFIEHSWYRDNCGKSGSITTFGPCTRATPKDTDDNLADFIYVDTLTTAGAGRRLGAPGPENLSSPIQRNASFGFDVLDPCVSTASSPNRVRDFTSDPANNSTFGTLDFRKTVTNNTGASVTRLRWRVIDITTFPAPTGIADLRLRTSGIITVTVDRAPCANGSTSQVTVQGTTLEQPPAQPNGGGFNSTLASGTVTANTPIANGASLDLHFLLGIQQTGSFKFYIIVEALP